MLVGAGDLNWILSLVASVVPSELLVGFFVTVQFIWKTVSRFDNRLKLVFEIFIVTS